VPWNQLRRQTNQPFDSSKILLQPQLHCGKISPWLGLAGLVAWFLNDCDRGSRKGLSRSTRRRKVTAISYECSKKAACACSHEYGWYIYLVSCIYLRSGNLYPPLDTSPRGLPRTLHAQIIDVLLVDGLPLPVCGHSGAVEHNVKRAIIGLESLGHRGVPGKIRLHKFDSFLRMVA